MYRWCECTIYLAADTRYDMEFFDYLLERMNVVGTQDPVWTERREDISV